MSTILAIGLCVLATCSVLPAASASGDGEKWWWDYASDGGVPERYTSLFETATSTRNDPVCTLPAGSSVAIQSTTCLPSMNLPNTFSSKSPNENADQQIKLAVEAYRGTEPCKKWYAELMCRYTFPSSDSAGRGYPCREECEIYRANCQFPLRSCDAFPTDTACCFRFSSRKMPWNPAQVLMPFSPVVFGLLILASGLFFWWSITRQANQQAFIRSRKVEYITGAEHAELPITITPSNQPLNPHLTEEGRRPNDPEL